MCKLLVCCTSMMLAAALPAAEANLAPMLDVGVTVPNGGILRLFPRASMKERKNLAAVCSADGLDAVLRELPVARHDWQVVDKRSRNDDPVCRILVEIWQLGGTEHDVVNGRDGGEAVHFL